jgi:transcriptional regulator of acetoin/glycerol metabolism
VAPVTDGSDVIALLYLERPKTFQVEKLAAFRIALAKAVRAAIAGMGSAETVQGSFLSMRPEDIIREQLLMALHQEEWCIARVARTLGVTRRTIYLRMQRLGIPRKPTAGESSA